MIYEQIFTQELEDFCWTYVKCSCQQEQRSPASSMLPFVLFHQAKNAPILGKSAESGDKNLVCS